MGASLYPVAETSASKPPAERSWCGLRPAAAALVLLMAVVFASARAQAAGPAITAKWRVEPGKKPGASDLVLTVDLEKGWHVNANDPDRPYLIPTTLEIDGAATVGVESIRYPDAVVHGLAFAPGTPLRLYEGTFAIRVRVAGEAPKTFDATLAFQACNDEKCLPPRSLAVPFDAAKAGSP
jgi:DsbC/DsbD-like thiol-disulfide interchange protein